MNGDSKKSVIAQAQTYFAVKTHEREMQEQFISLSEDERRLLIRQDIKEHNTALSEAAIMQELKHLRTLLNSIIQAIKVYMVA